MDRSRIRLATQLLMKAESTDADPESVALVERSYRLLAEILNQYEPDRGHTVFGFRRRERRFLRDRRADRRDRAPDPVAAGPAAPAPAPTRDPATRYRTTGTPAGGTRMIDLEL